jgi:hypothetical protein
VDAATRAAVAEATLLVRAALGILRKTLDDKSSGRSEDLLDYWSTTR